jgi:hypothetical protein
MNEWHVEVSVVRDYAAGLVAGPVAASVEAHTAQCRRCQDTVAAFAPPSRLDSVWAEVSDRLDTPRRRLIERLLVRVGVEPSEARLVVSTPALRLSWMLSICAVLVFAVAASAVEPQGVQGFLILAPILPVVGVGLAYGPWTDPMYEISVSAPYSGVRLLMLRTGAVLMVTGGLLMLAGVLIPGHGVAFMWLLPAAAMVALTLALAAWVPPVVAATLTSSAWLLIMGGMWVQEASIVPAFAPAGQACALALLTLAVAGAALAHRAQAYDTRRIL